MVQTCYWRLAYLTLNKSVTREKIVSFTRQTFSDCSYIQESKCANTHFEHKWDSSVIDEFTTNDELLSSSMTADGQPRRKFQVLGINRIGQMCRKDSVSGCDLERYWIMVTVAGFSSEAAL